MTLEKIRVSALRIPYFWSVAFRLLPVGSLLLTKEQGGRALRSSGRFAELIPEPHRTSLQRVGTRHARPKGLCVAPFPLRALAGRTMCVP